jgi:hypothetical protein
MDSSMNLEEEDTNMSSSPESNYIRLLNTISELESGIRVTEDWVEEHKKNILEYREAFPNFRAVNEEFRDKEFRRKADESEVLMSNLVHEIKVSGTINLRYYLILVKHIKTMCDLIWDEHDLSDMLGRMRM